MEIPRDPNLKAKLRVHVGDGEAMWDLYKRLEIGTINEGHNDAIKAAVRAMTILGTVGFEERSIYKFEQIISAKNATIEPPSERLSEHDLAVIMLQAIAATSQTNLAAEALDEYTRQPALRDYKQPAPNPSHLRSLSLAADGFGRKWEAQVQNKLITVRAAGGAQRRAGNSTHVDANALTDALNDEDEAMLADDTFLHSRGRPGRPRTVQ